MPPRKTVTRRNFMASTTVAGMAIARRGLAVTPDEGKATDTTPKVIDCHSHLTHHSSAAWKERDHSLIEAADKLGIDQLCCSILTPKRPATANGFRECNTWVAEGMNRYPGRILGYCYVNPGCGREALDEIRRCIEELGFMGIKLYNEYVCTDPILYPLVELAIELRVPILHHAGHAHYPLPGQPNISDGGHLAELGKRYPEACLICAHIGGGGDWEWTIRALRHAKNVFLDTSGSVTDEGMLELAVATLGADRMMFGCDLSMTEGVGKLRGLQIPESEKRKIWSKNLQQVLSMRS